MQNLGGQTKSIMVFSEVAYCLRWKLNSIFMQILRKYFALSVTH